MLADRGPRIHAALRGGVVFCVPTDVQLGPLPMELVDCVYDRQKRVTAERQNAVPL